MSEEVLGLLVACCEYTGILRTPAPLRIFQRVSDAIWTPSPVLSQRVSQYLTFGEQQNK